MASVVINTRFNNRKAEADLKELQAKAKETAREINAVEKGLGSATTKRNKLRDDLEAARQKAAETVAALDEVNARLDAGRKSKFGVTSKGDETLSDKLAAKLQQQDTAVQAAADAYHAQDAAVQALQQRHAELTAQLAQEKDEATRQAEAVANAAQAAQAAQVDVSNVQRAANAMDAFVSKLFNAASVSMFTPDAVDYYCACKVENYCRIQLAFLETNRPGRYLKLAGIDYGVYLHFSGDEIIKARVLEECDPLSAEISINTLNLTLFNQEGRFSILNPEGYFDVLQHRQKLTVWEDVRRSAHDTSTTSYCMGTFYLDDWSNEDDTLADFTAIDTIGLLDGSPFDGGVYDTHVASLAAEILSGYPYTLDSVLGEERIQGYIPAGTRREALQQLAFAIGAVVDCSRGEIIRIVPAPQRASGLIGTDRRLQDGSKVTLLALVTAVSVTAHRYIPGEASEELYKDTLEPGTYRVTFDAPAVADSLAVRGAELSERGVNHCTLTVSKAAEVCVTGRKYSDSATVLRREASNLPSNAQGNEVSVPDATLVSPDRAAAVAARVLDYYAQRYEQTFRMVAGDEKLADRLIVESFGGEMVRGVVTKLEFDLTGGFLADAKIVGRKLSNNAAAYAGEEIHAGERSFI